jgi:hypothetical protein
MHAIRESRDELRIDLCAPFRFAITSPGPRLRIAQTFGFRPLECHILHEQALTLAFQVKRGAPLKARPDRQP